MCKYYKILDIFSKKKYNIIIYVDQNLNTSLLLLFLIEEKQAIKKGVLLKRRKLEKSEIKKLMNKL